MTKEEVLKELALSQNNKKRRIQLEDELRAINDRIKQGVIKEEVSKESVVKEQPVNVIPIKEVVMDKPKVRRKRRTKAEMQKIKGEQNERTY